MSDNLSQGVPGLSNAAEVRGFVMAMTTAGMDRRAVAEAMWRRGVRFVGGFIRESDIKAIEERPDFDPFNCKRILRKDENESRGWILGVDAYRKWKASTKEQPAAARPAPAPDGGALVLAEELRDFAGQLDGYVTEVKRLVHALTVEIKNLGDAQRDAIANLNKEQGAALLLIAQQLEALGKPVPPAPERAAPVAAPQPVHHPKPVAVLKSMGQLADIAPREPGVCDTLWKVQEKCARATAAVRELLHFPGVKRVVLGDTNRIVPAEKRWGEVTFLHQIHGGIKVRVAGAGGVITGFVYVEPEHVSALIEHLKPQTTEGRA